MFGILAVLGGVAVAVLIVELYLRMTSTSIVDQRKFGFAEFGETSANQLIAFSDRGKRLNRNVRVIIRNHNISQRDVVLRTNSFGFRGSEFPAERPPGETRILVLGDSITVADYLPEDETFVTIAEEILIEKNSQWNIRLINAGVGDADLVEELNLLEDVGVGVDPDIVVIGFYLNDGGRRWDFVRRLHERGWLRRHSILFDQLWTEYLFLDLLIAHPDIAAWIETKDQEDLDWTHDRDDFKRYVARAGFDWGAAWGDAYWERVGEEMGRLKALSERYQFHVLIFNLPVACQVFAEFVEDFPQRMLRQRSQAMGFGYHDVLPAARENRVPDFFFDHCHPREHGNEIYGRELAEALSPIISGHRSTVAEASSQ